MKNNPVMNFKFRQSLDNTSAEIYVYDEIGADVFGQGLSSDAFKEQLDALGNVAEINVYINSKGGSVQDGLAIYSMLQRHSATVNVYIDSWACSIASVIAMAGNNVYMYSGSKLMIHNASTIAMGNAEELRRMADTLDAISESALDVYTNRSGGKLSRNKFKEMMDAETWISASDCVKYGLCDKIMDKKERIEEMSQFANFCDIKMSAPDYVTRDEVLEMIKQHAYSWEDVAKEKEEANKKAENVPEPVPEPVSEPAKVEDKPKKSKKAKQEIDFDAFADALINLL